MPTDYLDRPTHHQLDREILMDPEPPVSISHFTHVIRAYKWPILLSIFAIGLIYIVIALSMYLAGPKERVTSQPFRLEFENAESSRYPNGAKFNVADIISGPILTRVWQDNQLGDFISLGEFSRAVFVLESNREYELLAAKYQANLADPKLSAVDRERLQREFEMKAQSITKNEYVINLDRNAGSHLMPETLARKVLLDVLNAWADFAVNQQQVIAYQVAVISPEVLQPTPAEQSDLVTSIEVLRAKTNRIIANIAKLEKLPGATLARTPKDQISFEELRIRLDEVVRFRLEPLLAATLNTPGLIDRATTQRFLESQLSYDQRQAESTQRLADSLRDSIAVYEQPTTTETSQNATNTRTPEQPKSADAVVPQLSDTFLDRLVQMSGRAADAQYRQKLVDDYRRAIQETVPWKQAVAYDTFVLDEFKKPAAGSRSLDVATARATIEQSRQEVATLTGKMNELFRLVSRNMTASTQLFSITGPPSTRTLRSISAVRLAAFGFLVLLVALPAIVVLCLLHNRLRQEEAAEEYIRQERRLTSAETLP